MWCIRTGQWTLDDIYGVKSLSSIDTTSKSKHNSTIFTLIISSEQLIYFAEKASNTSNPTNHSSSHQASSSSSATLCHFASQRAVVCSLCGEAVAGSRYAPHLEKCMNGGKRGSKKHYDSLQDPVYKSKYKKEFVDPYPNSLVVRIRYKNGGKSPRLLLMTTFLILVCMCLFVMINIVLYGNTRRIGVSEEEFKAAQEEAANPSVIEVVEETAKDTNDSMPVGPIDLIVDEVKATTASKAVLIDVIL